MSEKVNTYSRQELMKLTVDMMNPFKQKNEDIKCAWCDRPNASIRIVMSREHPACSNCVHIWYDWPGITPEKLREMSLKNSQWIEA